MKITLTDNNKRILTLVTPVILFGFVLSLGRLAEGSQQFSELAKSFLHGKTYFLHSIGSYGQDPIFWHGRIYWGEGPMPAIILMPFVFIFGLFHSFFYQGYLQWILVLGVPYFIYKIAKILSYNNDDALIMASGFTLGSVFIGVSVVSSSWLYAQVLTTFLLFWSLYEFYSKKRWWLIGLICAAIFMTRATASPIILFFALELWQDKKNRVSAKINAIKLLLPFLIGMILIGLYNLVRFQSPFNGGYMYQLLNPDSAVSRSYGVFNPIHIPANLFSLIFRSPFAELKNNKSWILKFPYIESNPYGISIFVTSPYFLYLFTQKWKSFDRRVKNLMVATTVSLLLVLSFYGIGLDQFGYRYSLDFLPELFVILMIMYKKQHKTITRGMKFLLIGAGVLDFYMIWSFIII